MNRYLIRAGAVVLGCLVGMTPKAAVIDEALTEIAGVQQGLADLKTALEANQYDGLDGAFEVASGDHPGSLANRLQRMNIAVDAWQLRLTGVAGGDVDYAVRNGLFAMSDQEGEIDAVQAELIDRLAGFFTDLMTGTFTGAADPLYVGRRNLVIARMDRLSELSSAFATTLAEINDVVAAAILTPAVQARITSVASDATGLELITLDQEQFTVTAVIRNVGDVDVADVSARLAVVTPRSTLAVSSAAEMAVSGGTLAAFDNQPGGSDEATFQWTITYDGALADEVTLLSLEVLELGDEPVSFITLPDRRRFLVDPELTDRDLDLMPDDYELAHGLNPDVDDSDEDADGDGIGNLAERRLGTSPSLVDSDSDGLSDGEEVAGGADGFITDPLLADTDGDGVNDAEDGQPLDGGTTESGAPRPGEPAVAVSQTEVVLSGASPAVNVDITNAGESFLRWSVINDCEEVTSTSVASGDVVDGAGQLTISAPYVGYDFSQTAGLKTVVQVIDAFGSTKDTAEIIVCHLDCNAEAPDPDQVFRSGFEDPSMVSGSGEGRLCE